MKKVNLRDLYPDIYKNDYFVEVTEDVLETIRAAERAEAAYDRRMYRYKAYYCWRREITTIFCREYLTNFCRRTPEPVE